jgi:predicted DNA-binding transcriptional regulator YafY
MRADRLLSLILLLQAHGRLTAPTLAERLEVSIRTVMRDVEALSVAGIPVYTERGRTGGICLLDSYRTGVANLSHREAASLVVGQPRLAGELGLGDALDRAIEKITGAGGQALRGGIEHGRTNILVDVDPWMRSGDAVPLLPLIHDGLTRSRRLDLEYRDGEARQRSVSVDPLGLVAKAGVWYLVATPVAADGSASDQAALFRISRVRTCEVTEAPALRPQGFDLAGAWMGLREQVEDRKRGLDVVISVDASALPMVQRLLAGQIQPSGSRDAPARPVLRLAFGSVGHAVGSLIGLGNRVEVIEPASVRSGLRDAAHQLLEVYERG